MKNLISEYNAGHKSGKARIAEVGESRARREGKEKLDLCHSRGASTLSYVYWLGYLDAITYHKKDGTYADNAPGCPVDSRRAKLGPAFTAGAPVAKALQTPTGKRLLGPAFSPV